MWWFIMGSLIWFAVFACATNPECRTVCLPQDNNCKQVCKAAVEWK